MKIVKSFCRLGLVLLVLTSTAAASAEGDLWWAVATEHNPYGPDHIYGAAWDFASLAEAEKAALEECGKLRRAERKCFIEATGKSSCFFIRRVDGIHQGAGPWTSFSVEGPYHSRAEAKAAARHDVDTYPYEDSQNTGMVATIELVECAGVE